MNTLRDLVNAVRTIDRDTRAASPKCPECNRPDGGFVPAGSSAWEVGIVDRQRCPSETCPMRAQKAVRP